MDSGIYEIQVSGQIVIQYILETGRTLLDVHCSSTSGEYNYFYEQARKIAS
jgi:hypothetical protein